MHLTNVLSTLVGFQNGPILQEGLKPNHPFVTQNGPVLEQKPVNVCKYKPTLRINDVMK